MPALEDLLRQYSDMNRSLAEQLIIVEATVTKDREAGKGQRKNDTVLEAVLQTTKNSADARGSSPKNK